MTAYDALAVILILASAAAGWVRGGVREVITLLSFILAAFLALSVFAHLKRGVWRAAWGTLSWPEAGRSLALYLLVLILCAGAALGALLPMTEGDPAAAVRLGLRYLGV